MGLELGSQTGIFGTASKVKGYEDYSHKEVVTYWMPQIKAAEKQGESNREDAKQAEQFYRGDPVAWEDPKTWTGPETQENVFYRDVMVLTGQLLYSDPKSVVSSKKDEVFRGFAKASQNLNNYIIKEQEYKAEIKRALIQAVFRNVAYVHHFWDPVRQLPCIEWCANEVYPDVDCQGDLKRAGWIVEEFFPSLDDVLADPKVDPEVKRKLAREPNAFRYPSKDDDEPGPQGSSSTSMETDATPDVSADPSRIKLRGFKVWSRKGMSPRKRAKALLKKARGEMDSPSDYEEGGKSSYDFTDLLDYGMSDDPNPEDQEDHNDAIEKENEARVCITLIENFQYVLKAEEWPLDYFDLDSFPVSMLRLTELPGDLHGVSLFKVLKPLLKVINFILSFWFADVRESCRRDILVDEDALADGETVEKFGTGIHNQAIKTKKGRAQTAIHIQEYMARQDGPIARLLEITRRGHDDTSGVNDMARGGSGDVEKTKAEALLLNDRASEAIALIVDSVDDFIRDIVRKTSMCTYRYIEAKSEYEPCEGCGGRGFTDGKELDDQALDGADQVPCEDCGGGGLADEVIRKGADYFLTEVDAANWRDDLSLDRIRAEVGVDVEPGSTRRSNQERRQYQLLQLFNTIAPIYEKYGCWRALGEMVRRIAMGTEVPDAEALAPTAEEWAEAVQVAEKMRLMAANPPPPPPPPPDPSIAANITAQATIQKAQIESQQELQKAQIQAGVMVVTKRMDVAIKNQELQIRKREIDIKNREVDSDSASAFAGHALKKQELDVKAKAEERSHALESKKHEDEVASVEAEKYVGGVAKETEPGGSDQVAAGLDGLLERFDRSEAERAKQTEGMIQSVMQIGQAVEQIALPRLHERNMEGHGKTLRALEDLTKVVAAPVKVIRDAKGRVQGGVREVPQGGV